MDRIHEVYNLINGVYKKKPLNINIFELSENDKALIKQYAEEPSNFDGDNFRQNMYKTGDFNGIHIGHHTIYTIGSLNDENFNKLSQFARVLQIMNNKPYTVFWFLSPELRKFPPKGQVVSARNINGGYCQACRPETIVIYRSEDATRVFIHELMHAACLDDHSKPIPAVEAETEAWAELFYAMLMAKEYGLRPVESWNIQSSWTSGQNKKLREEYNIKGPADYAWRYTVGKEGVWRRWNLPVAPPRSHGNSLSLGAPLHFFEKSAQKD
jgi:hypothetical protein